MQLANRNLRFFAMFVGLAILLGFASVSLPVAAICLPLPAGGNFWVGTSPMHTVRLGHTATLLPNGTVLAAGGGRGGLTT